MDKHTPGPWEVVPWDGISKAIRGPTNLLAQTVGGNDEANAHLIAAAPDLHEQLTALIKYGWEVEKVSLYDEEGVEGWRWTDHHGTEHTAIGDWDDLPSWPDSARAAIAKALGEAANAPS